MLRSKKRPIQEGRLYSIAELADLARRGLQGYDGGVTLAEAAKILDKRYRTHYTKSDLHAAITQPVPVSYTHRTLPTKSIVEVSVNVVS